MIRDEQNRFSGRDETKSAASLVDFDVGDYRPYLDGLDLTDEQASELLSIMWDIMRMFVEMDIPAESWGQITDAVIGNPDGGPADVD